MVFANTILATAAAALAWSFAEWIHRGTPTMLGAASGAVRGPRRHHPGLRLGGTDGCHRDRLDRGPRLPLAVASLKHKLGYDDSLDVFGVHCVGGIIGALLTAVFCSPRSRGPACTTTSPTPSPSYSMAAQFKAQLWAWSSRWSGPAASRPSPSRSSTS